MPHPGIKIDNCDLSVVESLKAIEIAAQKYLLDHRHISSRRTNYSWINILEEKRGVLKLVFDKRILSAALASIIFFLIGTPFALFDLFQFTSQFFYEIDHGTQGHELARGRALAGADTELRSGRVTMAEMSFRGRVPCVELLAAEHVATQLMAYRAAAARDRLRFHNP